jgi:hypothetical protein
MRFARPVAMDEFNGAGIGLSEGGVIHDQQAFRQADIGLGLAQRGAASGAKRCNTRVSASRAAWRGPGVATRAASVQLTTLGAATKKLI